MDKKIRSVKLDLEFPFMYEGREITSLTFRRMKAKDALASEGEEDKAKAGNQLFATLADVDVELIEEMDLDDYQAMSEAIIPVMGKMAQKIKDEQDKAAAEQEAAEKEESRPSSGATS